MYKVIEIPLPETELLRLTSMIGDCDCWFCCVENGDGRSTRINLVMHRNRFSMLTLSQRHCTRTQVHHASLSCSIQSNTYNY